MPCMKLHNPIPLWLRAPRNSLWLIAAVLLLALIAVVSPQQLPVTLYKTSLIALAAVLGYWLDRAFFPYSRPDGYLKRDWRKGSSYPEGDVDFPVVPGYEQVYAFAQLRRAIVVAAAAIGMALGL